MQYLIWTLIWKLSMVKHSPYVKYLDVSLMPNIWDFLPYCSCSQGGPVCRDWIFHGVIAYSFKFFYRLELEGKDLYAIILYLLYIWCLSLVIKKETVQYCHNFPVSVVSLSFRVNFTTSGSIRSLHSPPQSFPCRPRSTTCCTSACLPSPPTLQPSSTTKLEPSACTSLMTWWAASSWFPNESSYVTLLYNLSRSATTDPTWLSNPTQHQNVWSLHPAGDDALHWFYKKHYVHWHQLCLCVFSDCQAFPWSDDETAGEDGERSRHHFWTQQRDSSGHWHSDGLRYPTQHHTFPSLYPKLGRLHSWHDERLFFVV